MDALPQEAEKLLAAEPSEFVARRDELARELRDAGRSDDAASVAALRKPTVVVTAVNRAAHDRPKAAQAAAEAALQVKEAQVGNRPEGFKTALAELDSALDLLADVALAYVAPRGKAASHSMRRRVRDLLRSAVADDNARDALVRGALTEELEAAGFSPFAGMAPAPARPVRSRKRGPSRAEQQEAKRREREASLREELHGAEKRLEDAARALRSAERERDSAERAVSALRAKLERID